MSNTTEEMKDIAKTIAREITEQGAIHGCSECIVDDYGRFGNFSLVCYLKMERTHHLSCRAYKPTQKYGVNLTMLVNTIKKVINSHKQSGAHKRNHECPQGVYRKNTYRGMYLGSDFLGYENNYIMIDLDFIPYHAESNTFAVQSLPLPNNVRPINAERNPKGQQLELF